MRIIVLILVLLVLRAQAQISATVAFANSECCDSCDPEWECAEFTARSIAAGGFISGLGPWDSTDSYGDWNGYNLRMVESLHDYLVSIGWQEMGTDPTSIQAGWAIMGSAGGGEDWEHACIGVDSGIVDCHNSARCQTPAQYEFGGGSGFWVNSILSPPCSCDGIQCGPDACGADCGGCPGAQDQCQGGQCVCVPDCSGRNCDVDGCGGTCGSCDLSDFCVASRCQSAHKTITAAQTTDAAVIAFAGVFFALGGMSRGRYANSSWVEENPVQATASEVTSIVDSQGNVQLFWCIAGLAHYAYQDSNMSWQGPLSLPLFCDELSVAMNAQRQIVVVSIIKAYPNILMLVQTAAPDQWSSSAITVPAMGWDFAVGTNVDGSLEIIGVGYLTGMFRVRQSDNSSMNDWNTVEGLDGCAGLQPVIGMNGDGRLEAFFIDTVHDQAVWHLWQISPAGNWSACVSMGFSADTVRVDTNVNGVLELVYSSGGVAWHTYQSASGAGGWSTPEPLASKEPLYVPSSFAFLRTNEGQLEVFSTAANHTVLHSYQTEAGNSTSWTDWASLGGWAA